MAQLFGYHNSVGGGSSSAAGRGGETNEVTNEQADKNEEQTWLAIDRTRTNERCNAPYKKEDEPVSHSLLNVFSQRFHI